MEGYSLGSDALIIEAPSPPIESPFGGGVQLPVFVLVPKEMKDMNGQGCDMAKFQVELVRERRPVVIEATRFEDSPDGKWITFIRVETVPGRFFGGTRREQVQRFRAEDIQRIERIEDRSHGQTSTPDSPSGTLGWSP
jgi:hypothetical protein